MFTYDFEVFKHDWLVVFIDNDTLEKTIIVNDADKLRQFYNDNIDEIFIGYNSRNYDQFIFKAIMLDLNPKKINDYIITKGMHGGMFDKRLSDIPLLNYDCQIDKLKSLKQLEGFMGNDIRETSVPFDINRKLTKDEIDEVITYCIHDVEQTMEVFNAQIEEFDSHTSLVKAFNLDKSFLNKTKAQLSAVILGAINAKTRNDEFDLTFPDTLILSDHYKYILDWYKQPINLNYKMSLTTNVWGVPHKFAYGGIHGCINNYRDDGYFILSDVASLYPSIMIEYNSLSRNVPQPERFKQIRDKRIELKAAKDPMQLPMKIVLNSTYGASKDKYNPLFDPLMANNVCVTGQLLILDLIDKLEIEFGDRCELVQSNTDGILVKLHNSSDFDRYVKICKEWSKRTRLTLEHDKYVKVIQKDVNNYIMVDDRGNIESKGSYVKQLNKLDYDLPIINKALVQRLIYDVSVEDTIINCNHLKEFQNIVKLSYLYKKVMYGDIQLGEKVHRVFASKLETDGGLYKVKDTKFEKIANTPDNCFIYNDDVNGKIVPEKLDKQWYIDLANRRLEDFLKDNDESDKIDIYELTQSYYPDFISLLSDIKSKTDVRPKDVNMLIVMGYFKEYGSAKKLMRINELYKLLQDKTAIRKERLEKSNIDIDVAVRFGRETPKQIVDLDGNKLLDYLIETTSNEEFGARELIELQLNLGGSINYFNSKLDKRYIMVTNLETRYSPKFIGYCLNNGETEEFKVYASKKGKGMPGTTYFKDRPFKEGDILFTNKFNSKPKSIKTEDGWEDIPNSKEWWITDYQVVDYEKIDNIMTKL